MSDIKNRTAMRIMSKYHNGTMSLSDANEQLAELGIDPIVPTTNKENTTMNEQNNQPTEPILTEQEVEEIISQGSDKYDGASDPALSELIDEISINEYVRVYSNRADAFDGIAQHMNENCAPIMVTKSDTRIEVHTSPDMSQVVSGTIYGSKPEILYICDDKNRLEMWKLFKTCVNVLWTVLNKDQGELKGIVLSSPLQGNTQKAQSWIQRCINPPQNTSNNTKVSDNVPKTPRRDVRPNNGTNVTHNQHKENKMTKSDEPKNVGKGIGDAVGRATETSINWTVTTGAPVTGKAIVAATKGIGRFLKASGIFVKDVSVATRDGYKNSRNSR